MVHPVAMRWERQFLTDVAHVLVGFRKFRLDPGDDLCFDDRVRPRLILGRHLVEDESFGHQLPGLNILAGQHVAADRIERQVGLGIVWAMAVGAMLCAKWLHGSAERGQVRFGSRREACCQQP